MSITIRKGNVNYSRGLNRVVTGLQKYRAHALII